MSKYAELTLTEVQEHPGNPRKLWDDADLLELVASIKEHGVIQPVTVVPVVVPSNPSIKYELVCGHRRYRASLLAGRGVLPAVIREDLTDEQALELQITENLQRKDVHPLDEAVAFQRLRDERHYSTEDVAKKIGKHAKYVVQRMKLNDLIEEIQKIFYSNKLFLTQAFEISRLNADDQKELYKTFLKGKWQQESFTPNHVGNMAGWISQTRMDLAKVAWQLDDATLVPKAGPCSRCIKNTACNEMLFPDMDKARCTDRSCFNQKKEAFLKATIKQVEENGEEVVLIRSYGDTEEKKFGKTVYREHDNFNIVPPPNKKEIATGSVVKAVWVGASNTGHTEYIRLRTNNKEKPTEELPVDLQIAAIHEREKRAKELDHVKIFKKLYDLMKESDYPHTPASLRATEAVALMYAMCLELPDEIVSLWFKVAGNRYDGGYGDRLYTLINKKVELSGTDILRSVQRAWILKKLYHSDLSHESSPGNRALYNIGDSFYNTELRQFAVEQSAIREKREKRVKERISELKPEKPTVLVAGKKDQRTGKSALAKGISSLINTES